VAAVKKPTALCFTDICGGSRDFSKGVPPLRLVFKGGVSLLFLVFKGGSSLKMRYFYPNLTKKIDERGWVGFRPPEPPLWICQWTCLYIAESFCQKSYNAFVSHQNNNFNASYL
jgi:hypothetical protein